MITRIEIENFKGIREPVILDLRPLTLLFGPNSVGKSSILHALHFAYETFLRGNPNPSTTARGGPGLDLGGFLNLVHGRGSQRAIRLRIGFTVEGDLLDYVEPEASAAEPDEDGSAMAALLADVSRETKRASVEIRVRWDASRNAALVDRCRVAINGKVIGVFEASADGRDVRLTKLNFDHPILNDRDLVDDPGKTALYDALDWEEVWEGGGLGVRGTLGALPAGPARVVFDEPELAVDDWPVVARLLRLLLLGPIEVLRASLEGFRYVGPLRTIPPRAYEAPPTRDEARWGNGLAAWDVLVEDPAVRKQTSRWMIDPGRLNTGYRFEVATNNTMDPAMVRTRLLLIRPEPGGAKDKDIRLLPHDVGVGISQVVPVVVASLSRWATATDGRRVPVSLVAIEQPELHVHPAMQLALGDLFILASANQQLLIETHSEHIVLRLQRRIREKHDGELPAGAPELRPEQVAVVCVQQPAGEGVQVVPVRLGANGEFLDLWPQGFFNERMKEVF